MEKENDVEQNGNWRDRNPRKKMQNEMLELKSIITKIKNSPEEFKNKFEQAEE